MQVPPGDPWEDYARTIVEIRRPGAVDLVVRPAPLGTSAAWPWSSRQAVHILTAWDPGEARPGERVNRERQAFLEAELRPVARGMWAAVGVDPVSGHREEGVAVEGVPEAQVLALGARYRQEAIFAWTPDEWAIVACTGERRLAAGWLLELPVTPSLA
jgi:hypothetical protein